MMTCFAVSCHVSIVWHFVVYSPRQPMSCTIPRWKCCLLISANTSEQPLPLPRSPLNKGTIPQVSYTIQHYLAEIRYIVSGRTMDGFMKLVESWASLESAQRKIVLSPTWNGGYFLIIVLIYLTRLITRVWILCSEWSKINITQSLGFQF